MQKRKRSAAVMEPSIGESSASAIADPDASDGEDELSRGAQQAQPNPPPKRLRTRPSKQSDEDKLSGGSFRARETVKVNLPTSKTVASSSPPPEIWRSIGQKISHAKTLLSLVRVSRAFRDIFNPILYARRIINLEYFSKPPNETPLPPCLEYVQDFRINVYEYHGRPGVKYDIEMNDELALWINSALKSTRCLRSFSWLDESCEDTYGPALILKILLFFRL